MNKNKSEKKMPSLKPSENTYIKTILYSVISLPLLSIVLMSTIHILKEEITYKESLEIIISSLTAFATVIIAFFTVALALVARSARNDWKKNLKATFDYQFKKDAYFEYKSEMKSFYRLFDYQYNSYIKELKENNSNHYKFTQIDILGEENQNKVADLYKYLSISFQSLTDLIDNENIIREFEERHDYFCNEWFEFSKKIAKDNIESLHRLERAERLYGELSFLYKSYLAYLNKNLRQTLFLN